MTDLKTAAELLKSKDNFEILTHHYPDGDTLGSAYALCLSLQSMGKNARVVTSGVPAHKYDFLKDSMKMQSFEREFVVSVDVAAPSLLGENLEEYGEIIDLCIDHHGTNSMQATDIYVEAQAAASAEIIYNLILELGCEITPEIANCIYTGISTDTGCFRYSNTTSRTHEIAADLMSKGADWQKINAVMFEIKSKEQLHLERMVYRTLEYHCNGKMALIYTTLDMLKGAGIRDDEVEGLASIPKQIEGVLLGLTLREKEDGTFKISARTNEGANAAEFCGLFGGGGHPAASGCTIAGDLDTVKSRLIKAAESLL